MTSLSEAFGVSDSGPGRRLQLVNILPATAFSVLIAALILAGAPQRGPSVRHLRTALDSIGPGGIAAITVGVVAVSVAFQPFELALIRILEGYWPQAPVLDRLTDQATWLQRRRFSGLLHAEASGDTLGSQQSEAAEVALANFPSDSERLLPTALGNTLRAMESSAGKAYGMDAIQAFPRLFYALPAHAVTLLSEIRNQLDASVRFCVLSLGTAVVSGMLLALHPWWLFLPATLLLFSYLSYRACLVAAANYGISVTAAFDVYHLRLFDEMGIKRPADTEQARELHMKVGALIRAIPGASVEYTLDPPAPSGGAAAGE